MERLPKRPRIAKANVVDKGKRLGERARRSGAAISRGAKTSVRSTRDKASETAGAARNRVARTIPWNATGTVAARQYLGSTIASSTALSTSTNQALMSHLGATHERASTRASDAREQALNIVHGILATDLASDLNSWLGRLVDGPATIYDRAMDAEYIRTHVGGSLHRLFDGGHTVTGAFNAARDVSPDDSIVQEAWGTILGLFKDGVTPRGLPIFSWDKDTFDGIASTLDSTFHIPKSWFYDLNTYDAVELLGGGIGAIAVAFNWNRADAQAFSRIVASTGIAAVASANPALALVTLVALAKAFNEARKTGDYTEFVEGLAKGGIGTGAVLVTASVVNAPGFRCHAGRCLRRCPGKPGDEASEHEVDPRLCGDVIGRNRAERKEE